MKTMNQFLAAFALLAGGLFFNAVTAVGVPMTFTVDSSESYLTITSAILDAPLVGPVPLLEQDTGSLTTPYGGSVNADVTATSITLTGGSSIVASNSGSWEPDIGGAAGSTPANYGGVGTASFFGQPVTALAAMREIIVDVLSPAIAISSGSFPAEMLVFGFDTNGNSVLDWNVSSPVNQGDTYSLTGLSTNSLGLVGTLTDNGSEMTLTVPIQYTGHASLIGEDDLEYILMGQLVARAGAATPPLEIMSSIVDGALVLSINTEIGQHYAILGITNLTDTPSVIDQFDATTNPTLYRIDSLDLPQQFYLVRQD